MVEAAAKCCREPAARHCRGPVAQVVAVRAPAPLRVAPPCRREALSRAGAWSPTRVFFPGAGFGTAPTVAERPAFSPEEGISATCTARALPAARLATAGPTCPSAAGHVVAPRVSSSGNAARYPAISACARRQASPNRTRGGREPASRQAGGSSTSATRRRRAAREQSRQRRPQVPTPTKCSG